MKTQLKLLFLPLFFLALHANAQDFKVIEDKKEIYRIDKLYFDFDSIQMAKKAYENFIITRPNSIYKLHASYYLAEILNDQKSIDSAILLYKNVLECTIPKSEDLNFRNKSANQLASIYIDKKEFKTALKYIDIAKKKFPMESFCGNAYASDNIWMADLYSSCYIGQGDYRKAIDVLTPLMFNNRLANNSKLVIKLYDTYQKIYSKEELKKEFVNAYKTLKIKKEKTGTYTNRTPTVLIFNKRIFVPSFSLVWDMDNLSDEQEKQICIDEIKKSEIYKLAVGQ